MKKKLAVNKNICQKYFIKKQNKTKQNKKTTKNKTTTIIKKRQNKNQKPFCSVFDLLCISFLG